MSKPKAKPVVAEGTFHADAANEQVTDVAQAIAAETAAVELPLPTTERPADDNAMTQVRDLLFGAMVEEMRKEFRNNARSVLGTVKSLHREFSQRTDELQRQLDAVQLASDKEVVEREQQVEQLSEKLEQSKESLTAKLENQQRELERTASRVGADINTQNRNQKRAMEELEFKLFGALEDYAKEFRTGKLNRNEFASLLSTLAGKVSGEDEQETSKAAK